ncbi:MAG: enoyl-CoA hydratase-related protein [Pigmentiphaga sp.]|uniref:enoyl-CoA hydratase-related protein n=1 Tax=Pigmentiphaga sp. TaxID=1977564 RepID=UPI0029A23358|nr:enoyl-CoA hydratase-related protein [Pigmentiphaga sp.]MDX3907361.1 enoyl-CoA hydratase-related protein [Pigmentiphaga sp.]
MDSTTIIGDVDRRGVATLVLNRPDKGNPFNGGMLAAVADRVQAWRRAAEVRVVVLRGAGRHFCTGADLGPGSHDPGAGPSLDEVCRLIDGLPKPTVSVVQGACLGGGLALAGCCDVLLAQRDAFFAIPEVRLGFAAAPMTPFFLRMMGARPLRRYGLTGERFSADIALRLGVAHELCDEATREDVLDLILDGLLLGAPSAQAEMKSLCRTLEGRPYSKELALELQQAFVAMRDGADGVEGRAAFREKRKPAWYPEPRANGELP